MKKVLLMLVVMLGVLATQEASAVKIKVSVASKSFWDGSKCSPRDKGGCVHVEVDVDILAFEVQNEKGKLTLIADKRIMDDLSYKSLFTKNGFYIGEITFDQNILRTINFTGKSVFSDKYYNYSISGNTVIVHLN